MHVYYYNIVFFRVQSVDIRDKTDHGNGQPEYGQQHINDSLAGGEGPPQDTGMPGDLSAAAAGSAGFSATLGVGIKEYMNVPWMPLVDIEAEPTGNSLDPTADRREQSGRGFTANGAAGRTGNKTAAAGSTADAAGAPAAPLPLTVAADSTEEDEFPYDEVVQQQQQQQHATKGGGNGTAGEIREPVLRPKSRFRMYRMPDGSPVVAGNGTPPLSSQVNGSTAGSATTERSFIVHLLPQKLMNMIEQAERYARMAFSPFMWPTKERAQRALKHFPRSVHRYNSTRRLRDYIVKSNPMYNLLL